MSTLKFHFGERFIDMPFMIFIVTHYLDALNTIKFIKLEFIFICKG